jgi:MFS family permease
VSAVPRARLLTPAFLLVASSMFAYFLSVGALLPALPRYVQGPLAGGSVSVGFAVGSFSIATTLLRPLAGLIGDRRGRRLIVVAGAAVAALSIFGYGLSESFALLIAMRLLNGVGEALFFTGAASIVTDLAPEERQAEALSLASTAVYTGLVVGPFLGESVLGDGRFASVWIVAGVCAVVAALLGAGLPETRPPRVAPGRTRFFHPAALLPGVIIAASVWGFAAFSTFVPLYALELGLNGSRYVFALFSVVVIGIRTFGARLPDALGVRRAASASLLSSIAGLVVIGLWGTVAGLLIGTVIAAVGQALAFPALMSMAIRRAPDSERASVVGTFTSFFDLGFGLGPLAMGLVAAAFDYQAVFLASAAVAAGGLWLLLGLRVGAAEPSERAPRAQEA